MTEKAGKDWSFPRFWDRRGLGFNKERSVISTAYEQSSRTNCVLSVKMTGKLKIFPKANCAVTCIRYLVYFTYSLSHWDFLPKFLSLHYYPALLGVQRSGQAQGTYFDARDDPTIRIRQFFGEIWLLRQ